VALVALALFPLAALLAPAAGDPNAVDLTLRLLPPSPSHWLGSDELGRDVLTRLVHGTRVSTGAGFLAAGLSLAIGAFLGALAGSVPERVDRLIVYAVDVVQSVPPLILIVAGAAFFRPSFWTAALLIGLTGWPETARLVRAEARRVFTAPFVEAARAAGASRLRLLVRHVLPHALPPALATAPYALGAAVLAEASLSFLGLGTPPPTPSWGRALADARGTLDAWWLVVPPAAALFLFILSARLAGDALGQGKDRLS